MPPLPDAPPSRRLHAGVGRTALAAIAVVAALALSRLPEPFAWDQAMFMLGARVLHHGGVLYRDYWDPKQPGLFAFYWLAGTLFGFDEVGLHALEAITMVGFALVLVWTLRKRLAPGWALAAAPLLTAGWYFVACSDWHLSQIEGLAGLPLWLAVWCAVRGGEDARRTGVWWLAGGVAGGVALTLKLLLAPVVLAIALVAWVPLVRTRETRRALVALVAGALGLAIPLAVSAVYFTAGHALPLALWTSLVYPGEVLRRTHGFRIGPFLDGLGWFARTWAPMLPFAAIGAWSAWRPRFDPLWAALTAWFAAGVFVILIQTLSYWEYQYLLLSVPVGLLAARGAAVIAEALAPAFASPAFPLPRRERTVLAAVAVALLFLAPVVPALGRLATLAHHRLAITASARRAYQDRVSHGGGYPKVAADLAPLLAPHARPGAIWVLGNPLYYWLSGRDQAVARNGASFIEFMTRDEWVTLSADLARARPAYIHVAHDYDALLSGQHPETAPFVQWLTRDYDAVSNDARGTWYAPRPSLATAP